MKFTKSQLNELASILHMDYEVILEDTKSLKELGEILVKLTHLGQKHINQIQLNFDNK